MLTDAPLPPSLTHHITNPPDHDDASTAASSAPTPVHHLPLTHSREGSIDGPSPEVPPTLADEAINHVNGHLKGEDSDMHDHHSAAGLTASGNAPATSALLSKSAAVDIQARAASASGDDMEIDGESNLDLSDTEPLPSGTGPLAELHPASASPDQGPSAAQPHSTFKTQSPAPSHSRSRSPNGVPLHPSDANSMPVDASVPATPALQDSQPDDASMADGERPAKRPRNAYEDSSASVRLLSQVGCVYFFVTELTSLLRLYPSTPATPAIVVCQPCHAASSRADASDQIHLHHSFHPRAAQVCYEHRQTTEKVSRRDCFFATCRPRRA